MVTRTNPRMINKLDHKRAEGRNPHNQGTRDE